MKHEKMKLSKTFPDRLRRVMNYRNLTVEQLSDKMNLDSHLLIIHWLNGNGTMKKGLYKKLCKVLDVDEGYLNSSYKLEDMLTELEMDWYRFKVLEDMRDDISE